MTGTLRGARPALEKAKPATGLTDGLLPVWMQHRVCGKKVVEAAFELTFEDRLSMMGDAAENPIQ